MHGPSLNLFITEITNAWLKQLRRRSQRHKMTWGRFSKLVDYWIPRARIVPLILSSDLTLDLR